MTRDRLTLEEIERIRACLDDGTYTAQERKDFTSLCDMAATLAKMQAGPVGYIDEVGELQNFNVPFSARAGDMKMRRACLIREAEQTGYKFIYTLPEAE